MIASFKHPELVKFRIYYEIVFILLSVHHENFFQVRKKEISRRFSYVN